jgi:hypothetical protein
MGFDLKKFETEQYKHRERTVTVPRLAVFFGEGEAAEWIVRGLTAIEIAQVRESKKKAKDIEGVVERLASSLASDKMGAVMEALGIDGDTPDDYVQRLTMLELASVNPKITRRHAVKLADVSSVDFFRLTDEILSLTGQGKLGESSASGTTPESGQALPSAPGADSEGVDSDTSLK